jgi:hypothetical protein
MMKTVAAAVVAFVLVGVPLAATVSGQADPLLTAYYADNESVLCSAYQTANGARFATYQWWLLGFVSGASHERNALKRPLARVEVARVLEMASEHCRAKPTDTLASTAVAIVKRLSEPQSRK